MRAADTARMTKPRPELPVIVTMVGPDEDPIEALQAAIDDCPLCREERARGVIPVIHVSEDVPATRQGRRRAERALRKHLRRRSR